MLSLSFRSQLVALTFAAAFPVITNAASIGVASTELTDLVSANSFNFGSGLAPAISAGQIAITGSNGTVWTLNSDGSNLKQIVNASTPVPQTTIAVPYTSNNSPSLTPNDTFDIGYGSQVRIGGGSVVFAGTDPRSAFTLSGFGLYSVPSSGGAVKALATGTNFPFDFQVNDTGQVAFQYHQQIYTVPAKGGAITAIAPNGAYPNPTYTNNSGGTGSTNIFQTPAISGNKVAFNAGGVIGGGSVQITSLNSPGAYADVADGKQFDAYALGYGNLKLDGNTAVFQGQNHGDTVTGIYAANGSGLTTLVDSKTPVPGGSGDFTFGPNGHAAVIAANGGIVAFEAADANGTTGIYEVSESGGPITKIVAVGDAVGGNKVAALEMGPEALSGGKLVFDLSCPFCNASVYEANLVPTRTLPGMQGGSIAQPVLLPVGNAQISQVQGAIGGSQTQNVYQYSWSGGWFTSDAFISGAASTDTYLFELLSTSGTLLDSATLDAADSFGGTLAAALGTGNYDIGLFCQGSCSDPSGVINFDTPVDGLRSSSTSTAPEPGSTFLVGVGLICAVAVLRRKRNVLS